MERKSKRGRPATNFGDCERMEFFRLRRAGFGLKTTLRKLGIGWGRYARICREDPEFHREAESVDEELIEEFVTLHLKAAWAGNAKVQEFLINRYDKAHQFAERMKLKQADLARRTPPKPPADDTPPPRIIIPGLGDDRESLGEILDVAKAAKDCCEQVG